MASVDMENLTSGYGFDMKEEQHIGNTIKEGRTHHIQSLHYICIFIIHDGFLS